MYCATSATAQLRLPRQRTGKAGKVPLPRGSRPAQLSSPSVDPACSVSLKRCKNTGDQQSRDATSGPRRNPDARSRNLSRDVPPQLFERIIQGTSPATTRFCELCEGAAAGSTPRGSSPPARAPGPSIAASSNLSALVHWRTSGAHPEPRGSRAPSERKPTPVGRRSPFNGLASSPRCTRPTEHGGPGGQPGRAAAVAPSPSRTLRYLNPVPGAGES